MQLCHCLHLKKQDGTWGKVYHKDGGPPTSQLFLISWNIPLFQQPRTPLSFLEGKGGPSSKHWYFSWWMYTPNKSSSLPSRSGDTKAQEPSTHPLWMKAASRWTGPELQRAWPKKKLQTRELAKVQAHQGIWEDPASLRPRCHVTQA